MRVVSILFVVLLAGCGYHVPGTSDSWAGGEAKTLYIQLFDNQTTEPYLENFITEALVAELSRSRIAIRSSSGKCTRGVKCSAGSAAITMTSLNRGWQRLVVKLTDHIFGDIKIGIDVLDIVMILEFFHEREQFAS